MRRSEYFEATRFPVEVLQEARELMAGLFPGKTFASSEREVKKPGGAAWTFESDAEFFSEYRLGYDDYSIEWTHVTPRLKDGSESPQRLLVLTIWAYSRRVRVQIEGSRREDILQLQEVFERAREASRLPVAPQPSPPVTVFIGHGRDASWRDLKDHLFDLHGYRVVAYEVGARAGHEIRDVLEGMLKEASFACLVLSGEDEVGGGKVQARQNVVHELGLFQGRLGYHRAIALVENGIELPSNIAGVTQLRYEKGQIAATFGDVLATLRREYGDRR